MAVSDLNFLAPTRFKYVFGISDVAFLKMVSSGRLKVHRKTIHPLVKVESIAEALYADREQMIFKKWDYAYSTVEKECEDAVNKLQSFPKCYFRREEHMPLGYYRVFYRKELIKVCVYVMEDIVRCVCYNRDAEKDLDLVYRAMLANDIEWID